MLRWIVSRLLNAVVIDDLLRVDGGKVFIGKRQLSNEEIAALKAEASLFEKSLLWKLMLNNLYWIANFKMIRGADRERDMEGGRMMTLILDTIQEFIDRLERV